MSVRPLPSQIPLHFIVVGTLLLAAPFHLRPENFIVDDGYFYPQIARFIVRGQGSTFNGIMPTNGYHPLWMLFCVAASWITKSSLPLIQILAAVQDLLLLGSVVALVYIARVAKKRGVLLGALIILFFNMVLGIWRLLEAPLALALQIGALILVVPCLPEMYRRVGNWRSFFLGIVLGLTMLSRLDLMFFVATLLVYEYFHRSNEEEDFWSAAKRVLIPGTIASLVVLPYLMWNWHHFHHLLPISGAIKSTFPHVQRWGFPPFTYPVVVAILLNGALLLKKQRSSFDKLCLLTAFGTALHLAYTLSFGGLAPWYLTTGYLSVALCVTWVVELLLQSMPSLIWLSHVITAVIFVLFLSLGFLRTTSNFSYTHLINHQVVLGGYLEPKRDLAVKLKATLPEGTRITIFDAPGGVAYFSGMNLLPVDGLVADYVYNKDLAQQGATGYAASHNIRYVIAPRVNSGQIYDRLFLKVSRIPSGEAIELQAPLTRIPAGTIILSDSDLLFSFREINPDLEKSYPEIGVWQLRPIPDQAIRR